MYVLDYPGSLKDGWKTGLKDCNISILIPVGSPDPSKLQVAFKLFYQVGIWVYKILK